MPPMRRSGITLDWEPEPFILANQFNTLGVNIRSFKEPLERAVRQVMVPSVAANFEQGGRPVQWEFLTDITIAHKRYKGASNPEKPLEESGHLRKRATQVNTWTIDGPKGEARYDQLAADAWYGSLHQTGFSSINGDEVPARPFAMIQEEDANEIEEIFFVWIEERIDKDITAGRRVGV